MIRAPVRVTVAPRFVKAVFTDFGSHTHTQYYDRANNRLIIYVSRSGAREGAQGTGAYQASPPNPYGGLDLVTNVENPFWRPLGSRGWLRAGLPPPASLHDVLGGGNRSGGP
jgi:hypothetical protein